jgi:hypothetical protein
MEAELEVPEGEALSLVSKETPESGATLWAMQAWSALEALRRALGVLRNCRI